MSSVMMLRVEEECVVYIYVKNMDTACDVNL